MELFPLPLFPQGGLASSVITTVWLGVFVVAFFNLRLGWMLSGLVVPGYIVPLLLVKPWAAGSIFLESCVTYFLVWLFSEYLSAWGKWSSVFGRDRFFALVLCSILVRLFFDSWLLPLIGQAVETQFHIQFDYRNNLHSFGLVITSLIANQFWKTGFVRGVVPLGVSVGVTYLLVRYGLMEWTNFSVGNLEYMYEDMAISILASPKAYLILVTTAFLASHMNLRYGWDFNGIMIPALLALQWYQPLKILATFAEAGLVLLLATLVLRAPMFQKATIEGARKLVLFFNISFAYKIALGYVLLWFMPTTHISDLYGFGYLLSTLIAIKMHDNHSFARLGTASLQISLAGVTLASMIGFSLTFLPSLWSLPAPTRANPPAAGVERPHTRLVDVIREDKVRLYQSRTPESFVVPLGQELETFAEGLQSVLLFMENQTPERLARARSLLGQVHYRIDTVQSRYLYLREEPPLRGWGIYVFDMNPQSSLVIEVPAPLDEWGSVEAGTGLFTVMHGKALAIAGASRKTNIDGSADVLKNPHTVFHTFHRTVARREVLQVRGYTAETLRALSGARRGPAHIALPHRSSSLWVKVALPRGLNLVTLKNVVGDYHTEWGRTPFSNIQRDISRARFAELLLNRADVRKLLAKPYLVSQTLPRQVHQQRIDGYLQDWLFGDKGQIAASGTNLYVPPSQEELLFFDQEVLTPLFALARTEYTSGGWSATGLEELHALATAAAILGYEITQYHHTGSAQEYLILAETAGGPTRRYWGTYVLRLGTARNYIVEIPRPLFELNTFEYGVSLFERLRARLLLISGTHPHANFDRSADLMRGRNKANLFNLVSQVALREAADEPMLVVLCRAFRQHPDIPSPAEDVLVAFHNGAPHTQTLSVLGQQLLNALEEDGLVVTRLVDGTLHTAGYEASRTPQSGYLAATQNKELTVLWLSRTVRTRYRQQTDNRLQKAQFRALGLSSVEADLYRYIAGKGVRGGASAVPAELRTEIARYVETQDVVCLQRVLSQWPHFRLERLIDLDSRQAFLLVSSKVNTLSLVANLSPGTPDRAVRLSVDPLQRAAVSRFIESRAAWLELKASS